MKNIARFMLLLVFVVTIGLNTSTYAQRGRQMSTAERRELDEERRNAQEERRMSTAERRDLQQERRERTEQIRRDLQERYEQREQQRQQQREQQREREMPTWIQREIQEERRNAQEERRMSTSERRDLQQERQERTEQIRRDLQQRREQRELQRQERLQQPQPYRGRGYFEPSGPVNQPNATQNTEGEDYFGLVLNEAERAFYSRNPHIAYGVSTIWSHAHWETTNRFPNTPMRNTRADAFRHAYASALLTRDMGWRNAKHITDLHEMTVGNPPDERAMDLHNNWVGIRIGSLIVRERYGVRQLSNEELADLTEQALRDNELRYLR
jgi:hypothetical protein